MSTSPRDRPEIDRLRIQLQLKGGGAVVGAYVSLLDNASDRTILNDTALDAVASADAGFGSNAWIGGCGAISKIGNTP